MNPVKEDARIHLKVASASIHAARKRLHLAHPGPRPAARQGESRQPIRNMHDLFKTAGFGEKKIPVARQAARYRAGWVG